jgi:DNA-binding CsgD family transcriptional regulator/tetratricopeptide (TPR) repeat protein
MRPILCPVLVGRKAELDELRGRLEGAAGGRGGVIVISGEAGAGKSRLTLELRRQAEGRGMRVLAGRAVQTSVPLPWRPLAEALAAATRQYGLPDDDGVRPYLPALGALVPGLSAAHGSVESPSLFACEGLVRVFTSLAGADGLLVVLEDLHWSDAETVAAVEYLADNLGALPVLCAVTLRDGEPGPAADAFARLRDRRAIDTLPIGPLSAAETANLVEEALGAGVPGLLAQVVHNRSDGLPLLAEEVLADLAASGSLRREGEAWTFSGSFPRLARSTVPDLVRRRLAGVTPGDRAVVEAAAVLGRRFDWRLLPDMLGAAEDDVLATLRRCVDIQIVRGVEEPAGQRFEFRHALTRDAVLDSLLPPERAALARTAVRVIAVGHPGLPGSWCELSADLAETAGDGDEASRLLLESARRSLARGALAAARTTLARAHAATADELLLADVEEGLTEAAALAGDSAAAVEAGTRLLTRLLRLAAADKRLAAVHLRVARAHLATGALDQAEQAVAAAESLDMDAATAAEGLLISAQVVIERRDSDQGRRLAETALSLAEPAGRQALVCEALAVIGRATRAADVELSVRVLRRGLRVAETSDLPLWRLRCLQELAVTEFLARGGIGSLREARELAVELGALFTLASIDLQIGLALIRSQPLVALDYLRAAVDASRRFGLRLLPFSLVMEAMALIYAGQPRPAEPLLAEAEALAPDDVDVVVGVESEARGCALLIRDDVNGALARFELGVQRLAEAAPANPYPGCGIWVLGRTVRGGLGYPPGEALHPSMLVNAINRGCVLMAQAVVAGREGRRDEAERLFAAGEALMTEPWLEHFARRLAGEAAIVDGWGRPVEWLNAAAAYFEDFGHAAIARSCRALLRRAGVPVPRTGRGDSAVPPALAAKGITRREMDVLHLVAEGLTNRDVAGRLYLSENTVETHVRSLLSKTGSSSRTQLVAVLARIPETGPA